MNCKEATELILSGENSSDIGLQAHIKQCESCNLMNKEWLYLKNIRSMDCNGPEISPDIDNAVKREAEKFLHNRVTQHRRYYRIISTAAVAACVVFFCWIVIAFMSGGATSLDGRNNENRTFTRSVPSSTIPQVISLNSPDKSLRNLEWGDVDMTNEFFALDACIEGNQALLNINTGEESSVTQDPSMQVDIEIQDIIT